MINCIINVIPYESLNDVIEIKEVILEKMTLFTVMDKIDQMDRHELNNALCFLQGRINEEKDYDDDKPKSGKLNEKKSIRPKSIIKGKIEELENNVYHYGGKNVGDYYIKVTEAIADYVGREKGKEMKLLVLNGIESTPLSLLNLRWKVMVRLILL